MRFLGALALAGQLALATPAYALPTPVAPPAPASCASVLVAQVKVGFEAYRKLIRRLPFLSFSPLPHIEWHLDIGALKSAKTKYKAILESQLRDGARPRVLPEEIKPETNEEKLALLETVREVFDQRLSEEEVPFFRTALDTRGKELVRWLSRWKPDESGSLDPEVLNRILDLRYLAANDVYFRLRNLPSLVASPTDQIHELVRARWITEITRSTLPEALRELGILAERPSLRSTFENTAGRVLYAGLNVFVNYQSIVMMGFPVMFPNFSLLNEKTVREDTAEIMASIPRGINDAYHRYQERFKKVFAFEYYKNWTKKIFPWIVSGLIAYSSFTAIENMNSRFEHDGIPEITNLESRDHLEGVLKDEMRKEYFQLNGKYPDSQAEETFAKIIQKMKINDLDQIRRNVQAGEKLPQSLR